jgi:steroid delta-isomerase-like uncharacterized protein
MSTEEIKARQRRLIEEFINRGDMAVAEDLIAEDHVALDPAPGQEHGRAGLISNLVRMRTAFPDLEWTIEEQVAEGDAVACYFIWRGTHQGAFLGVPPTGKRVTVRCMAFDHFVAGQCKATRMLVDIMSLMQQLGVVSSPAQASQSRL